MLTYIDAKLTILDWLRPRVQDQSNPSIIVANRYIVPKEFLVIRVSISDNSRNAVGTKKPSAGTCPADGSFRLGSFRCLVSVYSLTITLTPLMMLTPFINLLLRIPLMLKITSLASWAFLI